jgi:hypothetical protein
VALLLMYRVLEPLPPSTDRDTSVLVPMAICTSPPQAIEWFWFKSELVLWSFGQDQVQPGLLMARLQVFSSIPQKESYPLGQEC